MGSAPLIKPLESSATDASGSAYAPTLTAVAFDGSIRGLTAPEGGSLKTLELFPSALGSVRLFAGTDVSALDLLASDRDPATGGRLEPHHRRRLEHWQPVPRRRTAHTSGW